MPTTYRTIPFTIDGGIGLMFMGQWVNCNFDDIHRHFEVAGDSRGCPNLWPSLLLICGGTLWW